MKKAIVLVVLVGFVMSGCSSVRELTLGDQTIYQEDYIE